MATAAEIFAARLDAELERLATTEAQLDAGELAQALRGLPTVDDLHALAQDIRARARHPDRGRADEPAWDRLADAGVRAQRLHTEVFALLATQALRAWGVGDVALRAADAVVRQLLAAARVREPVVVALAPEVESMDHVASVLRLRFPGTTVWELPVVAHEVGHHVVRTLPTANETTRGALPLRELVDRAGASPRFADARWPHELAADVFATYALGATYAVACLTLRVAPGAAGPDAAGRSAAGAHPPWPWRVTAMLAAMRAVSGTSGDDGPAVMATNVVEPLWRALGGVPPDDDRTVVVEAFAEQVVDELDRHTVALRYSGADRAAALAPRLDGAGRTAAVADEDDAATLVDAAWRWRRSHPAATPDTRRAVESAVLGRLDQLSEAAP